MTPELAALVDATEQVQALEDENARLKALVGSTAVSLSNDLEHVRKLLRDEVSEQSIVRSRSDVTLPKTVTVDIENTEVVERCVRFEFVKHGVRVKVEAKLVPLLSVGDQFCYEIEEGRG